MAPGGPRCSPPMPRRVLHIDTGREWRGGQRQVFLLAAAQRERGDEPLVVAYPDAPLIRRLRASGLAASGLRARGEWDLAAARRLRALARWWRADVLHAHDARAHAIALAALVGQPELPLVVSRRVAFVPRGRVKYGRRVARFIAVSGAVRDALVRGGVSASRIEVVYDGVPTPRPGAPRDWRSECGWPGDAVICGLVGAMTAEKGVVLLDGIARALPSAAARRARLVLLGGASSGHGEIGGLPSYRAGFVDDIHAAMSGLDLLWHPATSEGLGTAVIDAMALGVPPIAFRVGGLPELIVDGECGLLVPPGDLQAFAAAVACLVKDDGRRRRMSRAGPPRAALFSVERMVEGTGRVYARVLKLARRPRTR